MASGCSACTSSARSPATIEDKSPLTRQVTLAGPKKPSSAGSVGTLATYAAAERATRPAASAYWSVPELIPTNYPPGPPTWPARSVRVRAVLLWQLGDHGLIGGVDGLAQLVVGDRAPGLQRVPARAPDIRHDGCLAGVAQQPLIGHLASGPALEAHRGDRA